MRYHRWNLADDVACTTGSPCVHTALTEPAPLPSSAAEDLTAEAISLSAADWSEVVTDGLWRKCVMGTTLEIMLGDIEKRRHFHEGIWTIWYICCYNKMAADKRTTEDYTFSSGVDCRAESMHRHVTYLQEAGRVNKLDYPERSVRKVFSPALGLYYSGSGQLWDKDGDASAPSDQVW